jgi:hypothetical protein
MFDDCFAKMDRGQKSIGGGGTGSPRLHASSIAGSCPCRASSLHVVTGFDQAAQEVHNVVPAPLGLGTRRSI